MKTRNSDDCSRTIGQLLYSTRRLKIPEIQKADDDDHLCLSCMLRMQNSCTDATISIADDEYISQDIS